MTPGSTAAVHACAVAWAGRGILLLGDPDSGKSTLVAQLLAAGAYLVADDLVRLVSRAGVLHAEASGPTGLIELRGSGIFRIATAHGVRVSLCVELTSSAGHERLPELTTSRLAGVEIPAVRVGGHDRLVVGQILLALCARRVH